MTYDMKELRIGDIVQLKTGTSDIVVTKIWYSNDEPEYLQGNYLSGNYHGIKRHVDEFVLQRKSEKFYKRTDNFIHNSNDTYLVFSGEYSKLLEVFIYKCKEGDTTDIVYFKHYQDEKNVYRKISYEEYLTIYNTIKSKKENTKTEPKKEIKMSNTVENIIRTDLTVGARLATGKFIYSNFRGLISKFVPKISWYKKLFMSARSVEIAEMTAVYGALLFISTKWEHPAIDYVKEYLATQVQADLIAMIPVDINNLFTMPIRKES